MDRSRYLACSSRVSVCAWLAIGTLALSGCASVPATASIPAHAVPKPMFHGHPWPLGAQGQPLEGTTLLMGLVDEKGHLTEVCINRSSGYQELDRLAVHWLAARHFNPELDHGKPVAGYVRVPVEFELHPAAPEPFPPSYCQTRQIADVLSEL